MPQNHDPYSKLNLYWIPSSSSIFPPCRRSREEKTNEKNILLFTPYPNREYIRPREGISWLLIVFLFFISKRKYTRLSSNHPFYLIDRQKGTLKSLIVALLSEGKPVTATTNEENLNRAPCQNSLNLNSQLYHLPSSSALMINTVEKYLPFLPCPPNNTNKICEITSTNTGTIIDVTINPPYNKLTQNCEKPCNCDPTSTILNSFEATINFNDTLKVLPKTSSLSPSPSKVSQLNKIKVTF